MLIQRRDIDNACSLSIDDVRQAITRTGYTVEKKEITGVEFKGMNVTGKFIYEVFGPDLEGGDDISLGNVYLTFVRNPFSNNLELYGHY